MECSRLSRRDPHRVATSKTSIRSRSNNSAAFGSHNGANTPNGCLCHTAALNNSKPTCVRALTNSHACLDELAEIYVKRGVDQPLARQVAQQLMAKDALTAHARDELGISEITTTRPCKPH